MSALKVFVHQVRAGFATNCSSSHSLIYLPGAKDDLSHLQGVVYDYDFVLASRAAKLPYIRMELEAAGALDEAIVAELGLPESRGEAGDYYRWSAPPELAREIARWALKDGVVALGGPDNAEHHLLSGRQSIDPSVYGEDDEDWTVRRDPLGFWALLSHWGVKLRLSFAQADHPRVLPFRSTWPELVDLKITDRCQAGCAFCYQDSGPEGAHARFEDVVARLDELAKCKVMEVVLGGGEPTEHPEFARIVGEVQRRDMRAAFTTRRLDWFTHVKEKEADWRAVHWAYSVNHLDELDGIPTLKKSKVLPSLPAIHVVMGTELSQRASLSEIGKHCRKSWMQLVLLGFKATGRAAGITALDDSHWFETCASSGIHHVAIDAALASKYDLELQRRGVPEWLYEIEDGRYAMHVDAVRTTCGPSSFCAREEMFPIPKGEDPIGKAFDLINERLGPSRFHRALELEQDQALSGGDQKRLVFLDAAMEGRCEACGAPQASPVGGERGRPRLLCAGCRTGEEK